MKAILAISLIYILIYAGIDIVQNGFLLDRIVFGIFLVTLAASTFTRKK